MSISKNFGQVLIKLARVFLKIVTLWLLATFLLFLLIEILPGDAFSLQVKTIGVEKVEELRLEMGLDKPVVKRYYSWLEGFLKGDMGKTFITKIDVLNLLNQPFLSSISLMILVILGLTLITLPFSVYAGFSKGVIANILKKLAVIVSSVPEFVVTIILMTVLCMSFKILPVISAPGPGLSVWDNPISLVMPFISLWMICSASMFRFMSTSIEIYADYEYVKEAVLSGLSKKRVLFVHLLPSALSSIGQIFAGTVPYILGGSIVVETLLSFPGLGQSLISAVAARETNLVMAIGSLIIFVAILSFIIADLFGKTKRRVYE